MKSPGKALKSAWELALENLEKREGTSAKLSAAQKAALAEVDRKTKAKIAELEILGNDRLAKALDNPEKIEQLKAEQRLAMEKERANAEEEKEHIRQGIKL